MKLQLKFHFHIAFPLLRWTLIDARTELNQMETFRSSRFSRFLRGGYVSEQSIKLRPFLGRSMFFRPIDQARRVMREQKKDKTAKLLNRSHKILITVSPEASDTVEGPCKLNRLYLWGKRSSRTWSRRMAKGATSWPWALIAACDVGHNCDSTANKGMCQVEREKQEQKMDGRLEHLCALCTSTGNAGTMARFA